jgi:hypothetical protein
MTTSRGATGMTLIAFARPMMVDPGLRALAVPVLLWESISRKTGDALATLPGVGATRPAAGEPLVFEVRKSLGMMNAIIEVSVGRPPNNDLVIDDESVSRFHAVFKRDDRSGQWSVADAGSSNGTFARGDRLEPEAPLVLRDRSLSEAS